MGEPMVAAGRNRVRVVDALRRRGPRPADIAATAGLSRATVSSLVAELLETAWSSSEGGRRRGAHRPPPVLLALDPSRWRRARRRLRHAHLRVALADLNADVRAERDLGLDVDHDADEALDAGRRAGRRGRCAEAEHRPRRAAGRGLGLPGPIDADTGTVGSTVILPGWAGVTPATSSCGGWACGSPSTTTRTSARWRR